MTDGTNPAVGEAGPMMSAFDLALPFAYALALIVLSAHAFNAGSRGPRGDKGEG